MDDKSIHLDRQFCVAVRMLYAMLEAPLPLLLATHYSHEHENRECARLWELLGGKLKTNYRRVVELRARKRSEETVVLFVTLETWRDKTHLPVPVEGEQVRLRVMFHMYNRMPEYSFYKVFVFANDSVSNKLVGDPRPEFEITSEPL